MGIEEKLRYKVWRFMHDWLWSNPKRQSDSWPNGTKIEVDMVSLIIDYVGNEDDMGYLVEYGRNGENWQMYPRIYNSLDDVKNHLDNCRKINHEMAMDYRVTMIKKTIVGEYYQVKGSDVLQSKTDIPLQASAL